MTEHQYTIAENPEYPKH